MRPLHSCYASGLKGGAASGHARYCVDCQPWPTGGAAQSADGICVETFALFTLRDWA